MVGNTEDEESLDSASTPPAIHASTVMKAAASLWKNLAKEHKDGWVKH